MTPSMRPGERFACPYCDGESIESGDELADHLTEEHDAFSTVLNGAMFTDG